MKIIPINSINLPVFRMRQLNATSAEIITVLGFPSNAPDSMDGKATEQFQFSINDKQFACWRYKNSAHFSIWGDLAIWAQLFGAEKVM
jgi:hypothetical protein